MMNTNSTEKKAKPKILITAGYYLPGFHAGGPLRSIVNLVNVLHADFDFKILTTDRDLGDDSPYQGIVRGEWMRVGNAQVRYLASDEQGISALARIIDDTDHDMLYLNSFFAPWPSIFPLVSRKLRLFKRKPVLLAPRGEFSTGAIALKSGKKLVYMALIQRLGLLNDVTWHASTVYEAEDIRREFSTGRNDIFIASDLPDPVPTIIPTSPRAGDMTFHIIFLSRISPMKNLHFALDILRDVEQPVVFNIYGPVEDVDYWELCQQKITQLPQHVRVQYHGAIPPQEVPAVMRGNDLFFMPTLGENFGHVIAEALSAGTPVLISDQTPWRNLDSLGLGNDLPLSTKAQFTHIIDESSLMPPIKRLEIRERTYEAFKLYRLQNEDVAANTAMFQHLIG